jgi:hypothetical protein
MGSIEKQKSEVKEIVKHHRFLKEFAREEEIELAGRAGKELEEILNRADQVLDKLYLQNREWIEEKIRSLGYLADIPRESIEDYYKRGLATYLRQEYRLIKAASPEETTKLEEEGYLSDAIFAYTFDFLRTLRVCKRLGISPSQSLDMARFSYRFNPDILTKLLNQFPDFEKYILIRACVGHSDPEEFLSGLRKKLPELERQFPEFERSVIIDACLGYSDPEEFLSGLRKKLPELERQFPEFGRSVIIYVCFERGDPAKFLTKMREKLPELQQKFPHLSKGAIVFALSHYPQKPESYLASRQSNSNFPNKG